MVNVKTTSVYHAPAMPIMRATADTPRWRGGSAGRVVANKLAVESAVRGLARLVTSPIRRAAAPDIHGGGKACTGSGQKLRSSSAAPSQIRYAPAGFRLR